MGARDLRRQQGYRPGVGPPGAARESIAGIRVRCDKAELLLAFLTADGVVRVLLFQISVAWSMVGLRTADSTGATVKADSAVGSTISTVGNLLGECHCKRSTERRSCSGYLTYAAGLGDYVARRCIHLDDVMLLAGFYQKR